MTPDAFLKKYVAMNQPVIYRDAQALAEAKSLWSADSLAVVRVSTSGFGRMFILL